MASSGTYVYAPDIGELVEESYERCSVDPATLTVRHARSARRSLNLLFSDWATQGVRLFAVDEQTQAVTDGTASYTIATGTLAILDMVVRRSSVDTVVHRIDRETYHLIPNKTQEGLPSQVYFDRKAGLYYLWNVPENSTDQIRYNRLRRIQDVTAATETPDVPYHWFEALASGLAAKLAVKFAPAKLQLLDGLAGRALATAKTEDRERVDTAFSL